MPHVKTGRPTGRPPKKSPQVIARILKVARTGLPLKFAAQAGDIDAETLSQWRVKDPEFDRALSQARLAAVEEKWKLIQKAAEDRVDADGKLLKAGDWRSLAWSLERAYPSEFCRPEVSLSLQSNITQNYLSINVTAGEYAGIEAVADPVRQSVASMFSKYRPQSQGNGEGKVHDVEATSAPEPSATEQSVITHRPDNELDVNFWRHLVSADSQTLVTKDVALFVARVLLPQVLGFKGHRTEVDFGSDQVTIEELFSRLEKACNGSGAWQTAQKLGGF
jgi:hypothetical protein